MLLVNIAKPYFSAYHIINIQAKVTHFINLLYGKGKKTLTLMTNKSLCSVTLFRAQSNEWVVAFSGTKRTTCHWLCTRVPNTQLNAGGTSQHYKWCPCPCEDNPQFYSAKNASPTRSRKLLEGLLSPKYPWQWVIFTIIHHWSTRPTV